MAALRQCVISLCRTNLLNLSKNVLAPSRGLHLQEHVSKTIMKNHGINLQAFKAVKTPQEAVTAGKELMSSVADELVIKAQILAGGRGKGTFDNGYKGGVQFTKDPQEAGVIAEKMLGYRLRTKQTTDAGVLVKEVTVAECLHIEKETYFAILLDRHFAGPVMVGCAEGGVDIEEVAENNPEAILKIPVDISEGVTRAQAEQMARHLNFQDSHLADAVEQIKRLYDLMIDVDATQLEINPFGETTDGRVVCFDAKVTFDDNAAFRQQEIFALDDTSESNPREVEAEKHGLQYIALDGNIGCLINGAGLAMSTMDLVKLHGGEPANFLDFGGRVTEAGVLEAVRIVLGDDQVKAILVNIFGGIVDCAIVAKGIVKAAKNIGLAVPMVVRLEGTNVGAARQVIETSGLPIVMATGFEDAAQRVVASLKQ